MLNIKLDKAKNIAILEPDGELTEEDFRNAAEVIDPFLEESGKLNGVIIRVKSFPGWDSFAAFIAHMRFVKDHHKKVSHVAIVTDTPVAPVAKSVASHFVSAEIQAFRYEQFDKAVQWISDEQEGLVI